MWLCFREDRYELLQINNTCVAFWNFGETSDKILIRKKIYLSIFFLSVESISFFHVLRIPTHSI